MTKTKAQGRSLPTASQCDILELWIPGVCVPKARARVTCNGTYHPHRYQDWRRGAETEILVLMKPSQRASLPIPYAEVRITLQGKHRSDLDNLAGSCLDALVSSGVLVDARLSCVPRLLISHSPKGKSGGRMEVRSLPDA